VRGPHGAPRTLVVVGDGTPVLGRAAATLADACHWPVLAEPSSGAWMSEGAVRAGALLLGVPGWLDAHRPESILVVGRPTLSRPVAALLAGPGIRVETVAALPRWADAARTTGRVSVALPAAGGPLAEGWRSHWSTAADRIGTAVDAVLDGSPSLTAGRLARDVVAALPAGALLVLGSSTPVRDVDRLAVPRGDLRVLANRGVAGIDGTISTAVGAALAAGGPAFALMGDLTFLHDLTGLVTGDGEPVPDLTVVVPDNDGGGIFAQLEPGEDRHQPYYRRVFGTPHGRDLVAVARALGWAASSVESPAELLAGLRLGGPRVVVVRTDQRAEAALARELRAAATAALG
jgi:2-succinyl-5-enolpyruvyl-6-hydroxy-3-cyclohexene-1-carboxylate synthase